MYDYGTKYDDILSGSLEDDFIFGRAGNDTLISVLGNDQLYGNTGDDTFSIFPQVDGATLHLYGGRGHDVLFAGSEPLYIQKLGQHEKIVVFEDDLIVFCKSIEEIDVGH